MQHSPEYLREALDYDSETGGLRWKVRPSSHFLTVHARNTFNAQRAGAAAFTSRDKDGYFKGSLDARDYRAHRVIFAIMTGRWPSHQVDHTDTDPGNNRWLNLREATHGQNQHNKSRNKRHHVGLKGVRPSNPKYANTKYNARIYYDGSWHYLGSHDTPELAHAAYCKAAAERFGEFARAG